MSNLAGQVNGCLTEQSPEVRQEFVAEMEALMERYQVEYVQLYWSKRWDRTMKE